jgi:hypothetical protein
MPSDPDRDAERVKLQARIEELELLVASARAELRETDSSPESPQPDSPGPLVLPPVARRGYTSLAIGAALPILVLLYAWLRDHWP